MLNSQSYTNQQTDEGVAYTHRIVVTSGMAGYITTNLYLVIEYTNNSNNLECTKENFDSINDKNNLGKELISKISSLGYTTKQLGYGLKPIGIYIPKADISKTTKYYFGISSV